MGIYRDLGLVEFDAGHMRDAEEALHPGENWPEFVESFRVGGSVHPESQMNEAGIVLGLMIANELDDWYAPRHVSQANLDAHTVTSKFAQACEVKFGDIAFLKLRNGVRQIFEEVGISVQLETELST